jgi:hypothetical protein
MDSMEAVGGTQGQLGVFSLSHLCVGKEDPVGLPKPRPTLLPGSYVEPGVVTFSVVKRGIITLFNSK